MALRRSLTVVSVILFLLSLSNRSLAQENKSSTFDIHFKEALAHEEQHRWTEAVEAYKRAISVKPDAEAYNRLGLAYSFLGRVRDAIKSFKKAVELKRDFAEASFNMGTAFCKIGDYEDAIKAFKAATRIKRDYVEAHYELANAYLKLGENGLALREQEALSDLDSKLARKLFERIYFVRANVAAPSSSAGSQR